MGPEDRNGRENYRRWGEFWLAHGWSFDEVNYALEELRERVDRGECDIELFQELFQRWKRGRLLPGEGETEES